MSEEEITIETHPHHFDKKNCRSTESYYRGERCKIHGHEKIVSHVCTVLKKAGKKKESCGVGACRECKICGKTINYSILKKHLDECHPSTNWDRGVEKVEGKITCSILKPHELEERNRTKTKPIIVDPPKKTKKMGRKKQRVIEDTDDADDDNSEEKSKDLSSIEIETPKKKRKASSEDESPERPKKKPAKETTTPKRTPSKDSIISSKKSHSNVTIQKKIPPPLNLSPMGEQSEVDAQHIPWTIFVFEGNWKAKVRAAKYGNWLQEYVRFFNYLRDIKFYVIYCTSKEAFAEVINISQVRSKCIILIAGEGTKKGILWNLDDIEVTTVEEIVSIINKSKLATHVKWLHFGVGFSGEQITDDLALPDNMYISGYRGEVDWRTSAAFEISLLGELLHASCMDYDFMRMAEARANNFHKPWKQPQPYYCDFVWKAFAPEQLPARAPLRLEAELEIPLITPPAEPTIPVTYLEKFMEGLMSKYNVTPKETPIAQSQPQFKKQPRSLLPRIDQLLLYAANDDIDLNEISTNNPEDHSSQEQ
eukprot:TRINITY_DN3696_c0_g1_i4.p1 TRINITY_DN3696_c0_g1~~TRINITY_DN3696_c0_g1_i4.p1  ORF type:complete len:558 (-),score=117.54 TRINITY_DN3696_c0_g1_i4:75-1685(-)